MPSVFKLHFQLNQLHCRCTSTSSRRTSSSFGAVLEPSSERQQCGVLPEGCEGIVGTTMTVLGALLAGVAASLLVNCANGVGFLFVIQVLPGIFS